MPSFETDTGLLSAAAGRISGIVSRLDADQHGAIDAAAFGHPDAIGAVGEFVSRWAHGRDEITNTIKSLGSGLDVASRNYTMAEVDNRGTCPAPVPGLRPEPLPTLTRRP